MVKLKKSVNTENRIPRKEAQASEHFSATPAKKAEHITETNGLKQIGEDATKNRENIYVLFLLLPKLKCLKTEYLNSENRWTSD